MLGKAIALAAQVFENVKDKGGQPYILHCLRVMNNLHTDDEELKIIACLHDVPEDDPRGAEVVLRELRLLGFSERIIKALDLLTHRKDVPYNEYIKALSFNKDARLVKLADLRDNSDITRLKGLRKKDLERMEKYHRSFIYLSEI